MDLIGPLAVLQGHRYALTTVSTATGVGFAYSFSSADQAHTTKTLQWLITAHRIPLGIASDQGSHFTGAQVQQWVKDYDVRWHFYVPY